MARRPRDIGTGRETWFVNKAKKHGLEAWRDENNNACSDVIIEAHRKLRVEVKERANLNAHKLVKHMASLYPGDARVMWHRASKSEGAKRKTPDGPPLMHVTVDEYLTLLLLAKRISQAKEEADVFRPSQELVYLIDWCADVLDEL